MLRDSRVSPVPFMLPGGQACVLQSPASGGDGRALVLVPNPPLDDKDNPLAKALTNDILMRPLVRFYANQLQAVKLDYAEHKDALTALGVTETPALLILKKDGKPKVVLQGARKLKLRKVMAGLKSVAPNRKKPW